MKSPRYLALFALSILGVILASTLIFLSIANRKREIRLITKQTELNQLQIEINRGVIAQQLVQNLTQELHPLIAQKPEIQALLNRYNASHPKNSSNP